MEGLVEWINAQGVLVAHLSLTDVDVTELLSVACALDTNGGSEREEERREFRGGFVSRSKWRGETGHTREGKGRERGETSGMDEPQNLATDSQWTGVCVWMRVELNTRLC